MKLPTLNSVPMLFFSTIKNWGFNYFPLKISGSNLSHGDVMSSNDVTNKVCILVDSRLPTWLPFMCRELFVWAQGGFIHWMFLTLHLSNYIPTSPESVTKLVEEQNSKVLKNYTLCDV